MNCSYAIQLGWNQIHIIGAYIMKFKMLATCVAVALLAGCGDDSESTSTSVQAYDGAIKGIAGTYSCVDDSGAVIASGLIPNTDSTGYASVNDLTVLNTPEKCTFAFQATAGAIDVSNSKDMSKVALTIPKGLASTGTPPRATPFTTLVAKLIESDANKYPNGYTEDAARTVLSDLGLSSLENTGGVTIAEIMSDLDSAITKVKTNSPALAAKLVATTHIVSDVLTKTDLSVTQISNATQNLVTKITTTYPNYPTGGTGSVVVDVKDYDLSTVTESVLSDLSSLAEPQVDEAKPFTEGDTSGNNPTGTGTGTGTDGSGTSGD